MAKSKWIVAPAMALLLALPACDDDDSTGPPAQPEVFTATLNAAGEVPTNSSTATGTARYELSADKNTLSWTVDLTNLQNFSAAHIHIGAPGSNGPVILPLGTPTNNRLAGTTTRATFTATIGGQAFTFDNLLDIMRGGGTYTNVHTDTPGVVTNQPGDLPAGEIRGQIRKT